MLSDGNNLLHDNSMNTFVAKLKSNCKSASGKSVARLPKHISHIPNLAPSLHSLFLFWKLKERLSETRLFSDRDVKRDDKGHDFNEAKLNKLVLSSNKG